MTSCAQRGFFDLRDEILDHRQGHVGFEQRHAHIAQRVLNIFFGQPRLAAQVLITPERRWVRLSSMIEIPVLKLSAVARRSRGALPAA